MQEFIILIKKIFKFINREKISLETEILPKLIKLKKLKENI